MTDYSNLISSLLPRGFAWTEVREHPFVKALSVEFSRVGDRAQKLLDEIDPKKSDELLEDWKALTNVPDECSSFESVTDEEIRAQLVQKLAVQGSLSARFFEEIGAFFGHTITVKKYVQFQAGKSRAGDVVSNNNVRFQMRAGASAGRQLRTPGWTNFFNVNLPNTAGRFFKAGSGRAGERLRLYENKLIECTIRKLKPAESGMVLSFSQEE